MQDSRKELPFGKKNYLLMIIGVAVIAIGFILMAMDDEPHGFGVLGLTVGPVTIMAGFVIEFFAILTKSEDKE